MKEIILKGRPAFPGKAFGKAIVCPESIQGWAGISDKTGVIIEDANPEKGQCIAGKILVLPYGKGSTGWSGHFHSAAVSGFKPAGWLFPTMDSRSGVASAVLSIPTITDFEKEINLFTLIQTGDLIEMDGNTGNVKIIKKEE